MIRTPYRCVELSPGRLAMLPDYAASRAIAREIEARERDEAARAARSTIRRALDALAPTIMARLEAR